MFYSIDQGGQPIPVTKTTLSGAALTFTISPLDLKYEGKLDGNVITGSSTQGGQTFALNLTRTTPETAWAIPEPPAKLVAMAKNADPSFEVATIKPSKPGSIGPGFRPVRREFAARAATMNDLIEFAYGMSAKQVSGGPGWLATDRYDLDAKPDGEGAPSQAQWKSMLRKLLVERVGLKFHLEKKELAAYVIAVAKGGPKLAKGEGDPDELGGIGISGAGSDGRQQRHDEKILPKRCRR